MAVSWLERGDPQGIPVLHFHGWPSSRLEQFASDALLQRFGLRWLSLDRPGYGTTPFREPHTLAAWATTVAAWADDQGIARFHVCGFSGGGPFAQGVAAHLGSRVLGLHLIASLAPFGHGAVTVEPPWGGAKTLLLDHAPGLVKVGFKMLNHWRQRDPMAVERMQVSRLHPVDRKILDHPDILERFARSHQESMRQGVDHIVADLKLYRSRWDLNYRSIACPVRIWVGDQDVQVPSACSLWMAGQMPHAVLKVFPGEAHYLAYLHAEEILSSIRELGSEPATPGPC